MAGQSKGGGQGRVRSQKGKGRMLRCSDVDPMGVQCERAIFAGRGTALDVAGTFTCGNSPLVPKARGRVGQQKQR